MSVGRREFVERATVRLAAAGVPSPRHDAEALLAHAVGTTRGSLQLAAGPLDPEDVAVAEALVARRIGREPLQHITGTAGFRYLDLVVGPGVFVPRPETEVMAGAAIHELRRLTAREQTAEPLAVDLCTGSGAIAAAMASEVPTSRIVAVELSEQAHAYAVRNTAPYGVDVRLGDMADAADDLAGTVQVVTANPPYIPVAAFETVAPEARDFDPPLALWADDDGLAAIRCVERVAARLLVAGGLVLCEHADVQSEQAVAAFAATGAWRSVTDHADLAGRPRFVSARRVPIPPT